MSSFQTVQSGRFFVHIFPTKQFRTQFLSLRLTRTLQKEKLTGTALLPYLWMEGTKHYPDAKNLIRRADEMYGTHLYSGIGKRGNRHVAELTASFPGQEIAGGKTSLADDVLALMLEVLTQPKIENGGFLESHVQREQRLHKSRIKALFDDKITFAMERCFSEVANGSGMGLPRLGYLADLEGLTATNLYALHQELLQQSEVHIYFIGRTADAASLADGILKRIQSDFPDSRPGSMEIIQPLGPLRGKPRTVIDRQSVEQGKLNLGFRTGVSYQSEEYIALLVANGILGGFPHSKLFVNVREKASLAYYASSRLDALSGMVAVQTGIEIQNYERALAIIQEQVSQLKQGKISGDELEFTRRQLQNQYTQALDQPATLAEVHFSGQLAGVDRGIPNLIEEVGRVNLDEVVDAARKLDLNVIYFLRNQEDVQDA